MLLRSLMSTREYYDWLRYFKYKAPEIPEIQMAMLTAMVAQGLGSKNAKAEDFILSKDYKPKEKEASAVMSSEDVQSFFGILSTPME